MPGMKYYDDLSSAESCCQEEEVDDEYDDDDGDFFISNSASLRNSLLSSKKKNVSNASNGCRNNTNERNKLLNNTLCEDDDYRIILHLDVDCFYCQCEHIDRDIDRDVPLAIGQKQIIVTCNYPARNKFGLSKLMSRQKAQEQHPSLLIVDGSDLEQYRKHGRAIYDCFRSTLQRYTSKCAVKKGCMDEMIADVTPLRETSLYDNIGRCEDNQVYIYGKQLETTVLTEDQSGVSSSFTIDPTKNKQSLSSRTLLEEMSKISKFALHLRQTILDETGFTTTIGLSVNPLLAKVASGLKKPGFVNILQPTDGYSLVQSMPLRKIPGIGSRTMKALKGSLTSAYQIDDKLHEQSNQSMVWTCGHLLKVPRNYIVQSLKTSLAVNDTNAEEQCDTILEKCYGKDKSAIVDDFGSLPKTLSVENTFRRGTMTTAQGLLQSMKTLYTRMSRLVQQRLSDEQGSPYTNSATGRNHQYPTVIRVTIRFAPTAADLQNGRRAGITRSRQESFDGQQLMNESIAAQQELLLKTAVTPLLNFFIYSNGKCNDIDVTRLNIALSNFVHSQVYVAHAGPKAERPISFTLLSSHNCSTPSTRGHNDKQRHGGSNTFDGISEHEIDTKTMSELPPDIAAEILNEISVRKRKKIVQTKPVKRSKSITDYFANTMPKNL